MKEQAGIMDRALATPTVLEHICRDYTDLKDADIEMLRDLAARVESLGRERGADVFIDCLCRDGNEAIVVAEYLREDSPHKFSTIGYIAREENEAGVLRTLHYGIDTREVRAVTRAERMVVQTVSPVKRGRATIGALVFENELEEAAEPVIDESPTPMIWHKPDADAVSYLTNLEWAGNAVDDMLVIVGADGRVVYRNRAALRVYHELGYVKDIIGMPYQEISLNDPSSLLKMKGDYASEEVTYGGRSYILRQYRIRGDEKFWAVSLHDITLLKQNEQLQRMKEAMLREVQHRTKNNLNMIYSLLSIQKRKIKDPESSLMLNEAMGMILSLSGSYEDSLRQKDEGTARLFTVIDKAKDNILAFAESAELDLVIEIRGDDLTIDVDQVASIVLIINEALFNSYKHAFNGRKKGRIVIEVKDDPITPEITIRDDGNGFQPEEIEKRHTNGMTIMRSVVEDSLHGKFTVSSSDEGTAVRFNFISEKGGTK